MGKNNFLYTAAVFWNSSSVHLKQQATEKDFKFLLKQSLLSSQLHVALCVS